jgi:uncharacterized membrane protein
VFFHFAIVNKQQETSVVSKKGQKSIVCRWKWTAAHKNNIGNDDISGLHHKKSVQISCVELEVRHYQNITIIFRSYLILIVFLYTFSKLNDSTDKRRVTQRTFFSTMTLRNEIIK